MTMNNMIDNITGGYKSSAKVTSGMLVLSLPDAVTPVVWRMDLSVAKSSAIEVRETEDQKYELVLKTPKADAHKIATYEFKVKATQALMAITKAMRKIEKNPVELIGDADRKRYLPVPVSRKKSLPFRLAKYAYIVVSIVAILFSGAYLYFNNFYDQGYYHDTKQKVASPTVSRSNKDRGTFLRDDDLTQPVPPSKTTGEVISADDFFKNKR